MKGYRTIAFNVAGLAALYLIYTEFPAESREQALILLAAMGFGGNSGLRVITTTPVGKKEE